MARATRGQELEVGQDEEGSVDRTADDDLDGYETSMSRLVGRTRGWLALFVALLLLVPLGGWLVDEWTFRRSGSTVREEPAAAGVAASVFLVRAVGCDGRSGSGSGFVAQRGGGRVVVTNRHVVEGARIVSLRPVTGGAAIDVAAHRIADDADVAVLELADPSSLPPPLAFGDGVGPGAPVRVVGFPAAMPFTTAGRVTSAEPRRLVLDLRTDPGASGSPVVDDDDRVVGQVFARTAAGQGIATPVESLTEAIATARPADPGC